MNISAQPQLSHSDRLRLLNAVDDFCLPWQVDLVLRHELPADLEAHLQRFPQLTEEQIMVITGIPREEIRHTRAVQDWLAEGRQEGEAAVTLRLLSRRCGPLTGAPTAQIQALPLDQLEALAAWLAANG